MVTYPITPNTTINNGCVQTRALVEIDSYQRWYDSVINNVILTNLQKLHFIIGHGILRPTLRLIFYFTLFCDFVILLK